MKESMTLPICEAAGLSSPPMNNVAKSHVTSNHPFEIKFLTPALKYGLDAEKDICSSK